MPCTRSCAEGESSWTVVVPGIRCRNREILLLSEVAFTVSMVVMRMSFAELLSTRFYYFFFYFIHTAGKSRAYGIIKENPATANKRKTKEIPPTVAFQLQT